MGHSKTSGFLLLILITSPHVSVSQSLAADGDKVSRSISSTQPTNEARQVKLRLTETVSSANAKVGQSISLEVVEPVEVDGKLLVAVGAHAHATVAVARRRGHNRREGKLVLTVQSVSRIDGTQVPLHSASLNKGSGQGPPIFGPCTFPLPADPVGLFRKGDDMVIPKGTELVAALASNTH